jgi:DNA-binding NarL/FixJ family response regulator
MKSSSQRLAVICDEQSVWLDAVDSVLHRVNVRVVGRTVSTARALQLVESERPDLLVTALKSQNDEIDSLTLIRRSCQAVGWLRPIVLSGREDADSIASAFAAGAAAYVTKAAHPDDLAAAVRQVFGPSVFFAENRTAPQLPPSRVDLSDLGLTRREAEILTLVAEGHSNAQVAKMLWVTEQTVKFHLSNTYRKLNVSNRTEASRWAQLNGLLSPAGTAAA